MDSFQGHPCWFELMTTDIDAAPTFYSSVFGWDVNDSGMPEMTYLLAGVSGAMVAGMASTDDMGDEPPPPNWAVYIAVDDCDATLSHIARLEGNVLVPATDIPGTGRFAMVTDPQGAAFGILQPLPMEEPQPFAFDPGRVGHGWWIELMTPFQMAGFGFYSEVFGWERGETVDMGEMGEYWVFTLGGENIGGMMPQGNAPVPAWMPYFGVDSASAATTRIGDAGGAVQHGPMEVPGGQWITTISSDPQGAFFGVVGGK